MEKSLAAIDTFIWDLDGCLHPSRHLYDIFDRATAQAGLDLGLKMSFDEALRINQEAQARGELFPLAYIRDHGISMADLHRQYHTKLDAQALVEANPALAEAFQSFGGSHALLTHANRDWADRVLRRLGLRDFFPDQRIIALEDSGYILKTEEETPFLLALERLGRGPDGVAMIEDTHRNLIIPHRMGFVTVLVHHKQPKETLPAHVDLQVETPLAFLQGWAQAALKPSVRTAGFSARPLDYGL